MKMRALLCSLALAALALLPAVAAQAGALPADLGKVLYVGDSITHGKSTGSWRWELHKIFADNGIALQEVGIQSGNYNGRGGISPGTAYCGVPFANRHAAQFSERAAEVAGRLREPKRLGGTGIRHWLRLDGAAADQWQLAEGDMPDTVFLALGTNDFVAEHSGKAGGLAEAVDEVQRQLIGTPHGKQWDGKGDMDAIVSAIREANPEARIVAIAVPCFSDATGRWCHKAVTPADYAAVQDYNRALEAWGSANKLTAVIDMNAGFRDAAKPGAAVATMLVDQMHPNAQGNLLYAGNVAKALGYAGRTAGRPRKAAADFPKLHEPAERAEAQPAQGAALNLVRGVQRYAGAAGQGATVELAFGKEGFGHAGKGAPARSGKPLLVNLNAAGQSGQLQIQPCGLYWEGRCLYSADMRELHEPIRLAYVAGDAAQGIAGGFYLWLGDMLVGEALKGRAGGEPRLALTVGELPAALAELAYDPTASWAPPAKRFTNKKD